jgi:hypothetical protein
MLNRDDMNCVGVREAATSTMAIIDRIQDMPSHVQVVAITAAFKLLMERYDMPPQDAFTVADNVMNHADGRRVEFAAVRAYMENELK